MGSQATDQLPVVLKVSALPVLNDEGVSVAATVERRDETET